MRADRSLTVPWRIQEEEGRWGVWSGGCLTIQVPSDQAPTPLPSEDRITDACKNITPPIALCEKVSIHIYREQRRIVYLYLHLCFMWMRNQ